MLSQFADDRGPLRRIDGSQLSYRGKRLGIDIARLSPLLFAIGFAHLRPMEIT